MNERNCLSQEHDEDEDGSDLEETMSAVFVVEYGDLIGQPADSEH